MPLQRLKAYKNSYKYDADGNLEKPQLAQGTIIKNVPGLTTAKLLKTVTGDLPEPTLAGYYEEYLLGESFHLAEHPLFQMFRKGIWNFQ